MFSQRIPQEVQDSMNRARDQLCMASLCFRPKKERNSQEIVNLRLFLSYQQEDSRGLPRSIPKFPG